MNDFISAGVLWLCLILLVITFFTLGDNNSKNNVIEQCSNFSSFSIGDSVYQCKLIKESA